jgi:hypothetical protein
MQGRRSYNSTLVPINPEIDWTIQQRHSDNSDTEEEEFKEEEPMMKEPVNQPPPVRRL